MKAPLANVFCFTCDSLSVLSVFVKKNNIFSVIIFICCRIFLDTNFFHLINNYILRNNQQTSFSTDIVTSFPINELLVPIGLSDVSSKSCNKYIASLIFTLWAVPPRAKIENPL